MNSSTFTKHKNRTAVCRAIVVAMGVTLTVLATVSQTAIAQDAPETSPQIESKTQGLMTRALESEIQTLQRKRAILEQQRARLEQQGEALDQQISIQAHELAEIDISQASYREIMQMLQTQRVELVIELAGLDARYKRLTEQEQTEDAYADEIGLVEEIVSVNENDYKLAVDQYRQGNVPPAEVSQKRISMLEAKLKLVELKSDQSQNPSAAALTEIAIDRGDAQARLNSIEKLLQEYYQARGSIESLKRMELEQELLQARRVESETILFDVQMQVEQLKSQLENR